MAAARAASLVSRLTSISTSPGKGGRTLAQARRWTVGDGGKGAAAIPPVCVAARDMNAVPAKRIATEQASSPAVVPIKSSLVIAAL